MTSNRQQSKSKRLWLLWARIFWLFSCYLFYWRTLSSYL